MSWSAWSRPTAGRRPRRCSRASRSAAQAARLQGPDARGDGPRRADRAPPQIALVDELAHTNAPGSRHPKRYLDVEELLSHGIDVYTAVNIQHIESLNDVVAQITHVRVRETVPDSVFDRADAIELIDLTPDDLIQRLKEGKVYVPKQAERALEHYFSPGNLTALRELALRRTAERVDEQLLTHMQANAIAGPWAAGERILVCVSEDPRAAGWCATPSGWRTGCTRPGPRSASRRGAACN
jgi:K+-sensing histidine kinase KdpD